MTRYIQRHSVQARITHGLIALACIVLILSGLVVFVPAIAGAVGLGVVQAIRLSHRIFAVVFIAVPLISMALSPRGFVHMFKEMFAPWDADDKKFMKLFVKYLFSPKTTHMPKQHETKSGQRVADGLLILFSIIVVVTGILLWAGRFISPVVFQWSLVLHDVSFVMITILMIAHAYLGAGIFQPYRGTARLMFGDGRTSESDALYHWGYWAEEELASGKNVVEIADTPLLEKK